MIHPKEAAAVRINVDRSDSPQSEIIFVCLSLSREGKKFNERRRKAGCWRIKGRLRISVKKKFERRGSMRDLRGRQMCRARQGLTPRQWSPCLRSFRQQYYFKSSENRHSHSVSLPAHLCPHPSSLQSNHCKCDLQDSSNKHNFQSYCKRQQFATAHKKEPFCKNKTIHFSIYYSQ